jgi:hypothetical protein
VNVGIGVLPNEHGQVWREYDIRPYTSRVDAGERPEQAIIDWILRETGTQTWFSEPLAVLSASRDKLYAYHTPQVQAIVSQLVDRFVAGPNDAHVFALRLITVGSPDWRAKAHPVLRPVTIQTPSAQAWIVSKEDAAVLLAELRRRTDFVEHNAPDISLHSGQLHTIARTRPIAYIRSVHRGNSSGLGYDLEMGQAEEGFSLEFSPLLAPDSQTVDAVLKLRVIQVEKLSTVWISVPTVLDARQRTQIQVPQTSSCELHERFRWPTSHVLLISCGLVPAPAPSRPATSISTVLSPGPTRADTLLLVELKGAAAKSVAQQSPGATSVDLNNRGRY